MANKKVFTDESLETFVSETKTYVDNAVSTKANSSHNHAASNITSGTLSSDRLPTVPIAKGGTGATTAAVALTNLGLTATAAELNYVDGVTSNIQTQLNGKAASSHTHSDYMTKANPTGTGSLSLNRKASTTVGEYSSAVGYNNEASGNYSYAEGVDSKATDYAAHAEGDRTTASSTGAHAEGQSTVASGLDAHAEGRGTTASGQHSHAEGIGTVASGTGSHAEGTTTTASGMYSHAEGSGTVAKGYQTHAEGSGTIAAGSDQHVHGRYNVESPYQYATVIGNGSSDTSRSNMHTLDWNGNAWFKGEVYIGGTGQSSGTKLGYSTVYNDTTKTDLYLNSDGFESNAIGSGYTGAVIDNLTSTSVDDALSAYQGKVLNDIKLDKAGGTVTGNLTVNGAITASDGNNIGGQRINNSFISFYPTHNDAVANTNRKGWMGVADTNNLCIDAQETNFRLQLGEGKGLEIYTGGVTFIDFHTNWTTSDYSQRIYAPASGSMVAYPGISNGSDRRMKKDITDLDERYLGVLRGLSTKTFRYTKWIDNLKIGFIAQDVEEVLQANGIEDMPFVDINGEDGMYTLDYSQFAPLSIYGWQYHEQKIAEQEVEIATLKNEIAELKELVQQLKEAE